MTGIRAHFDFPHARLAFTTPHGVVEAHDTAAVRPALRQVQAAARAGAYAVGFVAYEAAPAFDSALATRPHVGPAPLLWFGLFDAPHAADANAAAADVAAGDVAADDVASLDWQVDTGRDAYDLTIAGIRSGIAAGDFYQVNHTVRFRAACDLAPAALYTLLTAARHGLYHALIETSAWSVVSASPELFLAATGDTITTRPMKGTHRRGRWLEEDRELAAVLAASPKDRAENLMIVDLLRNDLGRIAVPGTVRVPGMFDVETYPTVHQLTSTITATMRAGVHLDDVFAATFPCGSVTGAPKVAAMRAIAAIERSPRGPYCGAIGVVRPDGSFTFNVAIRTLLFDHGEGTAVYGTGGGITWDSDAADEYDELISKTALLSERVPAFELVETLRLDDGGYARLERHMSRLRDSAAYWSFAGHTAGRARAALMDEAVRAPDGAWRVRLTANAAGDVAIERTPLDAATATCSMKDSAPAADPTVLRGVRLADTPVARTDRLLFHKTTARDVYDVRRAIYPDAHDVLLCNEEGEVTEFTTGNVVADINGVLCTPPRTCGLLAGTLRAELLAAGDVVERVITVDEIHRAARVWHINSVRGCVEVRLE